ncbi:lysophospholipid acyltransferase family protein [Chthonomonas calidirosea]|nr:lysophospholipid acyltransferase family protein [Chthonomonas calidirosea]
MRPRSEQPINPKIPWLKEGFMRYYVPRYLKRHFHTLYLYGDAPRIPLDDSIPLIVCLNHSSWWDLFVPAFVEHRLFHHDVYTVMDAQQLQRYALFSKMGVLGVDRTSLQGIKAFLDTVEHLLKDQPRSLWLTPQGEMVSNYQRPIQFQPGLAHIAMRLQRFHLLLVAVHYELWTERLPEAFVHFSEPAFVDASEPAWNPRMFLRQQEVRLQGLLDSLLIAVQRRDTTCFQPLLRGASGTAPLYDALRALRARWQHRPFFQEHGAVATPSWRRRKGKSTNDEEF